MYNDINDLWVTYMNSVHQRQDVIICIFESLTYLDRSVLSN